jgi:NADH:ubiquinone oxidoreductase subunit 2 (subunit N)
MLLLNTLLGQNKPMNFYNLHMMHKHFVIGLLFTLTILSLLGTPPTIGFFGKLLSFLILVKGNFLGLTLSVLIALVLLIFYLQTVRSKNTLRKKLFISTNQINIGLMYLLIFGQISFLIFPLLLPLGFDLLYAILVS